MRTPITACSLLLALAAGHASALTATRPLNIPAPNGEATIAYDMNAAGQVAAVLENDEGRQRGVLFEKGVITELAKPGGSYSDARAINPHGLIIGSARNPNGTWSAFLYDRARGMRDLGTLGGPSSYGTAINDAGDAAGFADTANGDWHAFVYRNGEMKDLGTFGGRVSYAAGMNNVGQVVGTASKADDYRRAFLYDPVRGMVELGTLGGRSSGAMAINDSGVVVGASETADRKWHAFIHDGKKMIDLGAMIGFGSSYATDINNAGHVVGTVMSGDERLSFVFREGKMTVHRGGKGLHLTNAINDGELVIGARMDRRLSAATMLSNAIAVPEPRGGTKFMITIGLIVLVAAAAVLYRRRFHGISMPSLSA